jgi:hypothetical protein
MKCSILLVTILLLVTTCSFSQSNSDSASNEIETKWDGYNKFRFGGYGEVLYQHLDYGPDRYKDPKGAPSDNRSYISLPRAVFGIDYKFRDDIIFGSEIEFEYGGTGSAMELEY